MRAVPGWYPVKYTEKYKNLRPWEQTGALFRAPFPVPCCVCGLPTEYIDMDYEAAFCGEECLKAFESRLPKRGEKNAF